MSERRELDYNALRTIFSDLYALQGVELKSPEELERLALELNIDLNQFDPLCSINDIFPTIVEEDAVNIQDRDIERSEHIQRYIEITGHDSDTAQNMLETMEWNLDRAISLYFEGVSSNDPRLFSHLVASPQDITVSPITPIIAVETYFENRGVSLLLFQLIRNEALRKNNDPSYWSIKRIGFELIGNHETLNHNVPTSRWFGENVSVESTLTYCNGNGCSLIDALQTEMVRDALSNIAYDTVVKTANVFLSFCYDDNFVELVAALELFFSEHPDCSKNNTYFWFDLFVNNQWRALSKDFDWWATTFRTAVKRIGHTVLFLSSCLKPTIFTRAWCLYEISCSIHDCRLSVALSKAERLSFLASFRTDFDSIYESGLRINLEQSNTHLIEDKERIFEVVHREGGFGMFNEIMYKYIHKFFINFVAQLTFGSVSAEALTLDDLKDIFRAAVLLNETGSINYAKLLFKKSFDGFRLQSGLDDHDTYMAAVHLSSILLTQNEFGKANKLFQMFKNEITTPGNTPNENDLVTNAEIADVTVDAIAVNPNSSLLVHNLAILCYKQGDLEKAKQLYHAAIDNKIGVYGSQHSCVFDSINNLAILLLREGNAMASKELLEQSSVGYLAAHGPDHPNFFSVMNNLAIVLIKEGAFNEARELFLQAASGLQRSLGPNHPSTASVHLNLANAWKESGDLVAAKVCCEKSLKGYEYSLGTSHADTCKARNSLIILLVREGNTAEANHFVWGLSGSDSITLNTYLYFACLMYNQSDIYTALDYYRNALDISEKVLGHKHLDTLNIVDTYAYVNYLKHQEMNTDFYDGHYLNQAKELYNRACDGYREQFGPDHLKAINAANNVAFLNSGNHQTNLNLVASTILSTLSLELPDRMLYYAPILMYFPRSTATPSKINSESKSNEASSSSENVSVMRYSYVLSANMTVLAIPCNDISNLTIVNFKSTSHSSSKVAVELVLEQSAKKMIIGSGQSTSITVKLLSDDYCESFIGSNSSDIELLLSPMIFGPNDVSLEACGGLRFNFLVPSVTSSNNDFRVIFFTTTHLFGENTTIPTLAQEGHWRVCIEGLDINVTKYQQSLVDSNISITVELLHLGGLVGFIVRKKCIEVGDDLIYLPNRLNASPRNIIETVMRNKRVDYSAVNSDTGDRLLVDEIQSHLGKCGPINAMNITHFYDCMITYRVASDFLYARFFQLLLTSQGYSVYLDSRCLEANYGQWEDEIREGFKNAKMIVCLISGGAVAKMREDDPSSPHNDNMLKELHTALETGKYIIPVLLNGVSIELDRLSNSVALINAPKLFCMVLLKIQSHNHHYVNNRNNDFVNRFIWLRLDQLEYYERSQEGLTSSSHDPKMGHIQYVDMLVEETADSILTIKGDRGKRNTKPEPTIIMRFSNRNELLSWKTSLESLILDNNHS
eukprot:gene4183-5954_t